MKHTGFLRLLAVVVLLVWSCSKSGIAQVEVPAPEKQADPWTVTDLMEMHFVGNGNLKVKADYEGNTKSQLSMNGTGTHASVSWTAGDTFKMLNNTQYTTYTTSESGESVEFSGGGALSGSGPFRSFYPASSLINLAYYNEQLIYLIEVPTDQNATIGSVAEGANLSFAQSATQDEDLHFLNSVAVIKFNLSGSLVSSIKKITFGGTTDVSGRVFITPSAQGEPEYAGLISSKTPPVSYVSLNGDFVAGEDYYIALLPGVHDSFYMTFTGSDGIQKTTKYSSKTLVLNRSRITDFGTINVGDSFEETAAPTPYIQHTTSKYATIAVIPDGYTAEEMDQYVVDAQSGINALFNTEPYKSYRGYFNVWILKVPSKESGARISDGTPAEQTRDCFFQTTWGATSYSNMTANDDRVFSFVEANCPDIVNGVHTIDEVPVLIIVNDTRYAGMAWNWGSGRTYCMVPKAYNGDLLAWGYPGTEASSVTAVPGETRTVTEEELNAMVKNTTGTWRNILVHEFGGHSIGKLGDEYWYNDNGEPVDEIATHSWPVPMSLNVSAKSSKEQVPWHEFFDADIQTKMKGISSKYAERIGVFQGAAVKMFYRWRSERISCMIDNRLYFSTWQRYILVNRFMTLAGLPSISVSVFLDNDDPTDPLRDGGSPVMHADGISDIVPPRMMPMLPPPVYVNE